jgi:SulP family sulfate permease
MRQPKILTTLRSYESASFCLPTSWPGSAVAMVALPLSLAIAIASGASPATGLVTAIIAGFLISLLGGSRVQIGGPTGAFIVVVHSIIAEHGYDGLVLATFMAGLHPAGRGLLPSRKSDRLRARGGGQRLHHRHCGRHRDSQIPGFPGADASRCTGGIRGSVPCQLFGGAREAVTPAALGIALVAIALIVGLRRFAPRFPG